MKGTDRYIVEGVSVQVGGERLRVVNMSVGGLFVATEGPVPPLGHSMAIDVFLPGRERGLSVTAAVTWVNEKVNPRLPRLPPGFGVKIQRVGFKEKMELLHYLRDMDPVALRKR
jgi:Tfp pilus assembly protein PilZ